MNAALFYLYFSLLRRRILRFLAELRRPAKLLGWTAPLALFALVYYYREAEFFTGLFKWQAMTGCAFVMLAGSLCKGFFQRGIIFDPPDAEFLFTGPFTTRQILFYRLLPNYLYALVQSAFVMLLFGSRLAHPFLFAVDFSLFQIGCFHVASGAAIFSGSIPLARHQRWRWVLLATVLVLALIYLRAAFDLRVLPRFLTSETARLFFYPAVTFSEIGSLQSLHEVSRALIESPAARHAAVQLGYLFLATLAALGGLHLLLACNHNIYEAAMACTTENARKREARRQGRRIAASPTTTSLAFPRFPVFRGAGALLWKNLVAARRSKRSSSSRSGFTAVVVIPLTAILRLEQSLVGGGVTGLEMEARQVQFGVAVFFASLAFLLQRSTPFDFRHDGLHLMNFRTLPFSANATTMAELAVPIGLCLAFQSLGIISLIVYGRFNSTLATGSALAELLAVVLSYPAVAMAVNAIWNTHYLLSNAHRSRSTTAVGTLVIVSLSVLVFFPPAGSPPISTGKLRVSFGRSGVSPSSSTRWIYCSLKMWPVYFKKSKSPAKVDHASCFPSIHSRSNIARHADITR